MRYKAWRSHSDQRVQVIVRCGRDHGVDYFDLLPEHVRHMGPWTGSHEGKVADLRTRYRLALMAEGFVVVHRNVTQFSPEVETRRHVVNKPPCDL